jgi:hypothetical protein
MEGPCSTGQSPQRAVVPVEEKEEEEYIYRYKSLTVTSFKVIFMVFNF